MIFMRVFIWYWCLHEIVQEIIMQLMYIEWTINQLYNREQTTDSYAKVFNSNMKEYQQYY